MILTPNGKGNGSYTSLDGTGAENLTQEKKQHFFLSFEVRSIPPVTSNECRDLESAPSNWRTLMEQTTSYDWILLLKGCEEDHQR